MLAAIVVLTAVVAIGATVLVANVASSTERTRIETAQAFFSRITTAGGGIPLFVAEIGDPPGRLSDLSLPITTARSNLCTKSYTAGDVSSWSARYAVREYPATGIPVGVGIASDTLLYEEVANVPRLVVLIRSVPQLEAMRLDARVDTALGTAGASAGVVQWNTVDATGLVSVRWSYPLTKKCAGANVSPTAAFTFNCTSLTCTFTDGSTDSDGTITGWSWAFGDATTSSLQNPVKAYAAANTYSVTLTVTDNGLGTGAVTQSVSVSNIVLAGVGRRQGPNRFADLTWTGATTVNVDIYRDGVLIVTTANDGAYTDTISNGTFLFKVCEQGTQICSNTVSVSP